MDSYQTKWRSTTLTFSWWDGGKSPVIITESDTTHIVLLPTYIRLCHEVWDRPPLVEMTPERIAAIRYALEDGWDEYNITLDETRPHLEALRAVLAETEASDGK